MKRINKVLVLGLVTALTAPAAWAGPAHFSILGAVASTNQTNSPTQSFTTSAKVGFGGGALVDIGLGGMSVGLGALYMPRKFNVTIAGLAAEASGAALEIPVTLGIHLGPMAILDLGGYYAMKMGTPTLTMAGVSANITGVSSSDFGLVGGFRVMFGKFFVGGRYLMGLKDQNDPAVAYTSKWTAMEGLFGLHF